MGGTNGITPGSMNGQVAMAAPEGGEHYVLRLYVSGMTPRSGEAMSAVRAVCERFPGGLCTLEVIDIYEQPDRATEAQIKVAPTVVRVQPAPERRLVGDLSDEELIIRRLELPAGPKSLRGSGREGAG